jgi:hypothetical protein
MSERRPTSTRRAYLHLGEFVKDFLFIWERRSMIRRTMRVLVPAAFRERLMMVVTEVNGCRYCSHLHAHLSLDCLGLPKGAR